MPETRNSRAYATKEIAELLLVVVLSFALCRGFGWPLWLIGIAAAAKALSSVVFYELLLRRLFARQPRLQGDGLIGRKGIALTPLARNGQIRIGNEIWAARSRTPSSIKVGHTVRVVAVDRLVAWVEPIDDSA